MKDEDYLPENINHTNPEKLNDPLKNQVLVLNDYSKQNVHLYPLEKREINNIPTESFKKSAKNESK